jgi:hypothetical protein
LTVEAKNVLEENILVEMIANSKSFKPAKVVAKFPALRVQRIFKLLSMAACCPKPSVFNNALYTTESPIKGQRAPSFDAVRQKVLRQGVMTNIPAAGSTMLAKPLL